MSDLCPDLVLPYTFLFCIMYMYIHVLNIQYISWNCIIQLYMTYYKAFPLVDCVKLIWMIKKSMLNWKPRDISIPNSHHCINNKKSQLYGIDFWEFHVAFVQDNVNILSWLTCYGVKPFIQIAKFAAFVFYNLILLFWYTLSFVAT